MNCKHSNTTTTSRLALWCCLLMVLWCSVGCSMGKKDSWKFTKKLNVKNPIPWSSDEIEAPQVPSRLVSSWTDTVLRKPGEQPQRGFGGRIMFFNRESEKSVRVDGQLVVYAFDEEGRKAYETQPTRRYVFPREQFARHESESKLGPSYSVWIPWDAAGGAQKNISLIARFEPYEGSLIVGEQTRHLLPGRALAESNSTPKPASQIGEVQLTSHSEVPGKPKVSEANDAKPIPKESKAKPTAVSIPLSKNWQDRLSGR